MTTPFDCNLRSCRVLFKCPISRFLIDLLSKNLRGGSHTWLSLSHRSNPITLQGLGPETRLAARNTEGIPKVLLWGELEKKKQSSLVSMCDVSAGKWGTNFCYYLAATKGHRWPVGQVTGQGHWVRGKQLESQVLAVKPRSQPSLWSYSVPWHGSLLFQSWVSIFFFP